MLLIGTIQHTGTCPVWAVRAHKIRSSTDHSDQQAPLQAICWHLEGLIICGTIHLCVCFLSCQEYQWVLRYRTTPAAALAYLDLGARSSKPPLHNLSAGTHICHTMAVRKTTLPYVLSICVVHCCTLITVGGTLCWLETLSNSPQASSWYVPYHEHLGSTVDRRYS